MQAVTTIGLDIAKSVFQIHGVDATGNGTPRTMPGRMRSWHQPAHHANAHQDDHDDDDGQYQLHRDFVWTSVGHWSSSPQIPRLKPPWATRSAALAFPVRRSSARHRNDRGMHRRWRYPGSRSEYRIARPRVVGRTLAMQVLGGLHHRYFRA